MTEVIRLSHPRALIYAIERVRAAPQGYLVEIKEPLKSRLQENKYHAMIDDIAEQCLHLNEALDPATWKRLLVDQFRRETMDDPELGQYWKRNGIRLIPSLDGSCVVVLGEQTRRFPKYVAQAFITWLEAWGAENDVRYSASEDVQAGNETRRAG